MVRKIIYVFVFIFLISIISAASIGTFKQNEDIELYQTCNNCTYCNFTSIKYPNSSNILSNVETTKDESYYYYTLSYGNLSIIGTYTYCYECGNAAEKSTGCINFDVNTTGVELTQPKSLIYLGLLALLSFLFVINVLVIPFLPKDNNKDEDGRLISVNQLKYLRIILFGTAYLLMMSITYVGSNIALAYLGTELIGNLLFNISRVMIVLMYPMILFIFIFILYSYFTDKRLTKLIERGFE